ncbi:MAG: DUF393 domain-containing protein [Flavobacteriaceae bacterium]|nr:DUF393 domain-containing protein [Flavobacteriaceae bacterium]
MNEISHQPLLFFDGVCNLCNSSVQYILKKDIQNQFKFASLQSDAAKQILLQFNKDNSDLDSIILTHNNQLYSKSTAVLKVAGILGGILSLALVFWVVPKPIRDWVYGYVAKNRYKWYGKRDICMIPTQELKSKFIG